MKRSIRIYFSALLAAALLTITACGGNNGGSATMPTSTVTADTTQTSAPTGEPQTAPQLREAGEIITDLNTHLKESGLGYVIPEPEKTASGSGYMGGSAFQEEDIVYYAMVSDESDRILNFMLILWDCPQNEKPAIARSVLRAYAPELSESEIQTLLEECQADVEGGADIRKADCRGIYFAIVPITEPAVTFYAGNSPLNDKEDSQPSPSPGISGGTAKPEYKDWPDNEFTRLLPKPDFSITKITDVTVTGYKGVELEFEGWNLENAKLYAAQIKESYGFNKEIHEESSSSNYTFGAKNAGGYQLRFYVNSDGSGSYVIND